MQLEDNNPLEFPEKSGIYAIINIVNDKRYIGSAVNFKTRKQNHFSALKRGDHKNIYLQNAWNKEWDFNFIFVILEITENLLEYEQKWIDKLKPEYNLCQIAGRRTGYISTQETKNKISQALKGKKKSIEHTINAALARRNYKHSEKTKEKLKKSWINRSREGLGRSKKLDKWPHELGYSCKCNECKNKRNEYQRIWKAVKNARQP